MGYRELLRKEWRECRPWVVAAGVTVLVAAVLLLRLEGVKESQRTPGTVMGNGGVPSALAPVGWLVFSVALTYGAIVAARQFLYPFATGEWAFLLHRRTRRRTLVTGKVMAAMGGLVGALGVAWALIFLVSRVPGVLSLPPPWRTFWEGWLLIAWGALGYVAVALACVNPTRWYTTRLASLALTALLIPGAMVSSTGLATSWLYWLFGMALLTPQLYGAFLRREF